LKRSREGEEESVCLCLFDGKIDELGPGVAGLWKASAPAAAGTAATAAIAIAAAAEANKQV